MSTIFHVYPYGTSAAATTTTKTKVVHFLRHAQGTHNVRHEYRHRSNFDAPLTALGKQQCRVLARRLATGGNDGGPSLSPALYDLLHASSPEDRLFVTSPLRRCIQTATLALPPLLVRSSTTKNEKNKNKNNNGDDDDDDDDDDDPIIRLVAHDAIRETVNFNCDRRRTISEIIQQLEEEQLDDDDDDHDHHDDAHDETTATRKAKIDFQHIEHDHDETWRYYQHEYGFGCDETYTGHRESGEIHVVAERGRAFFRWLSQQPQRHVVVCTHSAFLRCLKNYGHRRKSDVDEEKNDTNDGKNTDVTGVPHLPPQHRSIHPDSVVPVLQYHGGDGDGDGDDDDNNDNAFAQEMQRDYENCEIRSMVIAFE